MTGFPEGFCVLVEELRVIRGGEKLLCKRCEQFFFRGGGGVMFLGGEQCSIQNEK